jgi:hypothetical protein
MLKIAISGKARTGKNTVSKILTSYIPGEVATIAFADPIKRMAEEMFPSMPKEFLYGKSEYRSKIIPGAFKNEQPLSVRDLLIDIGTNLGRSYKEDIWLDAFDYHLKTALNNSKSVIITDVRFRNEFDHLKSLGFYQIRVSRETNLEINHISETNQDSINDNEFDYILNNNRTIESLEKEVKNIYFLISSK